jgi:hypothetical protein
LKNPLATDGNSSNKTEMRYKNMMYGNRSAGYGYSPDRSKDIDRFNPSTRANYSTSYNTNGYGCYTPTSYNNSNSGHYDGRGQWVKD